MSIPDPKQTAAGGIPIPGDAPVGRSVREDARFSELRQEIDKLTSILPEAANPDWDKVAALGAELLTTLGKDISVASWLATALLRLHGEAGISAGAMLMAEMCSRYWQELFPPRTRARMGAIDWWQDQVAAWLEETKPEYLEAEVKESADAQLALLDQTVSAAEPDNPLRLHMLRAQLARLPTRPKPVASPEASAARDTDTAPETANAPVLPGNIPPPLTEAPAAPRIASDASAAAFLSESARFCLDAADALLQRDLSLPASYALRRVALWAGLAQLPPTESGRTRIPAPEAHILPGLDALLNAKEYEKAVRAAESQGSAYFYWLDLSRVSARALAALGHDVARLALEGEVLAFTHRFPDALALSFADGTPFADGATRQWLEEFSARGGSADPFEAELSIAAAHPPAAALEALGALLVAHPGDHRTLSIFRAAFETCQKGELWPPLPYLAMRLLALIAAHGLLAYDPAAAARALSAASSALGLALTADPGNVQARAQYERISEALAGLQPHRLLPEGAGKYFP